MTEGMLSTQHDTGDAKCSLYFVVFSNPMCLAQERNAANLLSALTDMPEETYLA